MTNSATSHLLPVFARVDLGFERGEGAWLIATNGERYLDFTSGVAVNALGHCHPHLVAALQEQATRLWHMSNLFRSPDGDKLAARLCEQSFADLVFFCNSGAEAMECAIKVARRYHAAKGHPERYRLVTFEGAFHGRTLGTLAATGSAKYLEGFGPPLDGFDQVPHGDLEAVKKAIGPQTAAILIEPVQGEGGVRSAPNAFFKALRQLCDDKGLLLIFDEVQTGMGRTGDLFAYKRLGVTPDIMSLAKALGGGFPIGACLATAEAASGMTPGSHGSTFGGNPLAIAAANAVLDVMLKPGFFDHVQKMSLLLKQKLASVVDRYPAVLSEVRGEGLLIGVKAVVPSGDLVNALRDQKLLTVGAGDNVVRFLAPLIVNEAEIEESVQMLERACVALSAGQEEGGGVMSKSVRHFLDISELPPAELRNMLAASIAMKAKLKAHEKVEKPLEGKTLAMIFERPSTRTRVSFDVGMRQLGGEAIMLTGAEMQLGRGETIADTARVLSRYVDAIMIRILNHDALLELAAHATVPVINGLTRRSHPCQVMADLMTFEEHRGPIEGRTVAWTGDDNNVLASWAHAAERFKFQLNVATPPQLAPNKAMKDWIKATQAPIVLGTDPEAAVRGADCVVTDTWVSMGDKDGEHRHNVLKPYQVNAKLMSLANKDAIFMHCLPAHRGEEVTDEVIDGPQSVVFDEAENRLHAQKGILAWCFNEVA